MGVPGTPVTGAAAAVGASNNRLRQLDVALDNATGVFAPGDSVAGHVCCDFAEDARFHGCRIGLTGLAEVSWVEVDQKGDSRPETVVGRQTLFNTCSQLFGKGPEEKATQPGHLIRAGFQQFRFHFQLPEKLPSSFEHYSDTGRVKARIAYSLRVDLENSWRTASHSWERKILVLQSRDLNRSKSLIEGVWLKKDSVGTCCFCISKGRIRCELSLPKSGYVPGETMDIGLHLVNSSSACVESTHITFQQRLVLKAGQRSQTTRALIFSISGQRVRPGASGFYHDVIHIPPLPPSGRHLCQVLGIEYIVHVKIEAAGTLGQCESLELSAPIVIGTIPFDDSIFANTNHVVPCYAHFDFNTGDIVEHSSMDLEQSQGAMRPVYRYYKTERRLSAQQLFENRPPRPRGGPDQSRPAGNAGSADQCTQNGVVTLV